MINETVLKRPNVQQCKAHLIRIMNRYGGVFSPVETKRNKETFKCLEYMEAMEKEFAIRNQMIEVAADILEGAVLPHQETDGGEPTFTVHPREVWLKGLKRQAMMDLGLIAKGEDGNGQVPEMRRENQETGEQSAMHQLSPEV